MRTQTKAMAMLGHILAGERAKEPVPGERSLIVPAGNPDPVLKRTFKNVGDGWTIMPSPNPSAKPQERKSEGLDSN